MLDGAFDIVEDLLSLGLDGIEVFHPSANAEQQDELKDLLKQIEEIVQNENKTN